MGRPLRAISTPTASKTDFHRTGKPNAPANRRIRDFAALLDGDGRAGGLELGLDLFGFLLGDVFLDVLRGAFDQVLGFLQAEVGTDRADFLDHVDLLVATGGEDNRELGLHVVVRARGGAAGGRSRGRRDRSGGGYAPLFFKQLG